MTQIQRSRCRFTGATYIQGVQKWLIGQATIAGIYMQQANIATSLAAICSLSFLHDQYSKEMKSCSLDILHYKGVSPG